MHLENLDVCYFKSAICILGKFTRCVFKIAKFVSIESVCLKFVTSSKCIQIAESVVTLKL